MNYFQNYSNKLWDEWANEQGFKDKKEMLEYLYREWTMEAISNLLGVAESTVYYQLKKLKIKSRKRGYPKEFIKKRGNPLSEIKIKSIHRRYKAFNENITYAELGRQLGISEITAKKYIIINKLNKKH